MCNVTQATTLLPRHAVGSNLCTLATNGLSDGQSLGNALQIVFSVRGRHACIHLVFYTIIADMFNIDEAWSIRCIEYYDQSSCFGSLSFPLRYGAALFGTEHSYLANA